jgi:membrane protein YdbS with pleckstrin-like domain
MSKFCTNCGKILQFENAEICPYCGVKIDPAKISAPIRIPKNMSLMDGEVPIWFGHISWAANFLILLIGLFCLLTVILFFITIMCVIIAWINVSTSEYFVSNKRIYAKRGLISRVLNDIKIEWVTNVYFQQGIVGRILNFGNLGISTPGERGGAVEFLGISDPLKVKAIIEDILTKYRRNP